MTHLIDDLIGCRVHLLLAHGAQEFGILRGVGEGLICVDLDARNEYPRGNSLGEQPIRVFYPLVSIRAFRLAVSDEN